MATARIRTHILTIRPSEHKSDARYCLQGTIVQYPDPRIWLNINECTHFYLPYSWVSPWIQEVVYLYMLIIVTCLILSGACFRDPNQKHVCDRLRFGFKIVKSNECFVNYWLKHDGMIVRMQVYLSSLLLALTSEFHFAKIWITLYILRNIEDWTRLKLQTSFWLRSRFRVAMTSCFWSRMWRQEQVSVRVRQNTPQIAGATSLSNVSVYVRGALNQLKRRWCYSFYEIIFYHVCFIQARCSPISSL